MGKACILDQDINGSFLSIVHVEISVYSIESRSMRTHIKWGRNLCLNNERGREGAERDYFLIDKTGQGMRIIFPVCPQAERDFSLRDKTGQGMKIIFRVCP